MSTSIVKYTIFAISVINAVALSQPSSAPGRPVPNLNYLGLLALLSIPFVIGIAALFFVNYAFVCNNSQCGPPIAGAGPCAAPCCESAIPCSNDGTCGDRGTGCGPSCDCTTTEDKTLLNYESNINMTPSLYVTKV